MNSTEITTKLRAAAAYLKETRVPVGEKEIIERILTAAVTLEKMADDEEEKNKQEEKGNDADDQ